ncbi:glycerate kinase [Paracoccus sp. (in: a-proteobacteria)]|uniref:glycerate kinase type-2 family protein n=1 Tax=Paracoccus sp. TaxID=267 RepID=UPI0026E08279|nr:DUF4147 domain-containing protein [Paracoccus sp. (in: a-proteobacteria)]MDO5646885.1 DUF4147 domain-containing protein [Paracoccus sp. (in: a-proteobacteria)]
MRERALALLDVGVRAADPAQAVARHLRDHPVDAVQIIALGKAARAMAGAALNALPDARALIVTNAGNDAPLPRATVLTAGHPVPDAAGLAAAEQVARALRSAQGPVLALISGGGSAMLPAPVAGVSLTDKQAVNRLLLGCGADIVQTNLIRQALSVQKGGGWLRLCPAPITALILSDVPGDDLRVVASGPTVAPIGSVADAAQMARDVWIWDDLPDTVRAALARERDPVRGRADNVLIGSNSLSLRAMMDAGAADGGVALSGDVQDCAERLIRVARDNPNRVLVFGGETTVRLTGDGMGGRNQELALRFARAAGDLPGAWCFAAMGSDGRDGPGFAAGGIVGPDTLARIRAAGMDPDAALMRNDSTPALDAAGAVIVTGATGTNVADLAVFIGGEAR